jgi:elongator complex protein 1
MRNLKNIRYEQWIPPVQERPLTAATWDLSNDSNFLCTFGPSEENALIELVRVDIKPDSQYYSFSNLKCNY